VQRHSELCGASRVEAGMPALDAVSARSSRPVVQFFVLAFAITWGLQLPGVLAKEGWLPGPLGAYLPFAMLGIFGPVLAATIVTAREGGRAAVRELFAGLLKWRAPLETYLVPLVLPGVLLTALLCLLGAAGRHGDVLFVPPASRLVLALVISVAEEVGWRGFALPRLQKRMGPVAASGIIAVLWMLWHIPMFLGAGVPLSLLVVMSLLFFGGSFVYTWAFNRSGGSLLVAVAAHFGVHLNNSNLALPRDVLPLVVHAIVYAALGLALLRPAGSWLAPSSGGRFRRAERNAVALRLDGPLESQRARG
jgi:uncharacterized protein